jgi:hypothetical protein
MASIKILDSNCLFHGCSARATREVFTNVNADGGAEVNKSVGFYCGRHGDQKLRELTKQEWAAARKAAEPMPSVRRKEASNG